MAFSILFGTRQRYALGNRWRVVFVADEVDNTGSYVTKESIGLSRIDSVTATAKEDAVSVQAFSNSQDGSAASAGDLFLKTSAGTHDVNVEVIGR
jgi:hypothetical protein